MFSDVLSNICLVPVNSADKVAFYSKATTEQSALSPQYGFMESDQAVVFQVPYGVGDTVLGRDTEQHLNVIWYCLTFPMLYSALLLQLAKYFFQSPTNFSIKNFSTAFGSDNYMMPLFPFNKCLILPIIHWWSSLPVWGFSRLDRLTLSNYFMQSLLSSHWQSR